MARMSEEEVLERDYYKQLRHGCLTIRSSDCSYSCPFCFGSRKTYQRSKELHRHAFDLSGRGFKERAKHLALERYIRRYYDLNDQSDSHYQSGPAAQDHDELFVWPSVGILANLKTEMKNGKRVGESGSKLRDELTRKGFNALKVTPLWDYRGHSGYAIVDFGKDWTAFKNALAFEKSCDLDTCGKKDYKTQKFNGEKIFGWLAREDDYKSMNIVGVHLRKNGDLKTISEKEEEEKRKDSKLVSKLKDTLEDRSMDLKEMESKYTATLMCISKVVGELDEMLSCHNEEIRKMQQREHDNFKRIILKHENFQEELAKQAKELNLKEKELQQRESKNDSEIKKLLSEKSMIERATKEQKKNDEKMVKLAKQQQRQKETLHKKILQLEKQLDSKQALELQIERYRGALQVMRHMGGDEDIEVKKKMDDIHEMLKEKEENLEALEDLNQALIVKERRSNDELQQARKEIIKGLKDSTSARAFIGVKSMGDLDIKPFLKASKSKLSGDQAQLKAVELCTLWDSHLRDPNWHPFKVITLDGKTQEIIDEEDEKLKNLKTELGEEVYETVICALKETNECNPSGRYVVQELWNFKENRRARIKEGVDFILRQWKTQKQLKKN